MISRVERWRPVTFPQLSQSDHGDHAATTQSTAQTSVLHSSKRVSLPHLASALSCAALHPVQLTRRRCVMKPPPQGAEQFETVTHGPTSHDGAHSPRSLGSQGAVNCRGGHDAPLPRGSIRTVFTKTCVPAAPHGAEHSLTATASESTQSSGQSCVLHGRCSSTSAAHVAP